MKLQFSQQIFQKYSNIKFHENPSSGSRVAPSGRTNMTKFIVAFRHFVYAPKHKKTKSPTRLTAGRTVAATCTYCPFCQHNLQGRYFIWQLPVVTSCRLVFRTDAALSADRPNA